MGEKDKKQRFTDNFDIFVLDFYIFLLNLYSFTGWKGDQANKKISHFQLGGKERKGQGFTDNFQQAGNRIIQIRKKNLSSLTPKKLKRHMTRFHKYKSLLDCNEGDFETQNEKVLDVHKTEEHKAAKIDVKDEMEMDIDIESGNVNECVHNVHVEECIHEQEISENRVTESVFNDQQEEPKNVEVVDIAEDTALNSKIKQLEKQVENLTREHDNTVCDLLSKN